MTRRTQAPAPAPAPAPAEEKNYTVPAAIAAVNIIAPAVQGITEARGTIEAFAASIDGPEDRAQAARWIDVLAAEVAELEKRWATITVPLHQAHKAACAMAKPAIEPRREAIQLLKDGVAASIIRDRKRAEAELAAATTAEQIARIEAPEVPKGLSASAVVSYRIVDEAKVPDRFWKRVLDDEAIASAVGAGEEIPGVEVTHELDVRRTGKRGGA